MITVKNLSKHFGGIKAVDGVDLHIDRGSITGLVGPNGAGKTTMFNLIAGLYQPTEGEIVLDGEDITDLTSHQLFHKGLLRTFQIAHEFPTLSVLENLMMVPANQLGEHLINTWLKRKKIQEEEKALRSGIFRNCFELQESLQAKRIRKVHTHRWDKEPIDIERTRSFDSHDRGRGTTENLPRFIVGASVRYNLSSFSIWGNDSFELSEDHSVYATSEQGN